MANFPDTMELLQTFARHVGLCMSSVILELGDQWASKRRRWWAALVPADLPDLDLRPWTCSADFRKICQVMPVWPQWPAEEERALRWTEHEKECYSDPRFGTDARRLDVQGQAPTALHSYGNALTACPCGCRSAGFSLERLLQGGLRGFGVWSLSLQDVRFPHPNELAVLNTLPPSYKLPKAPRSALCLIGQVAAPLQMVWIQAQVLRWAELAMLGESAIDPDRLLREFKCEILQQKEDHWVTVSTAKGGFCSVRVDGVVHQIRLTGPTTVGQLCWAELRLHAPGLKCQVRRGVRTLSQEALLQPDSSHVYQVDLSLKKQARSPAVQTVQVLALTASGCRTLLAPLGLPLADLLSSLGLPADTVALDLAHGSPCECSAIFGPLALDLRPLLQETGPALADTMVSSLLCDLACSHQAALANIVSPALADALLQCDPLDLGSFGGWLADLVVGGQFVAVFADDGHWACLSLERLSTVQVRARYYDGVPGRCASAAFQLAGRLAWLLDCLLVSFEEMCTFEQSASNCCGAIALAHAAVCLGLPGDTVFPAIFARCTALVGTLQHGHVFAQGGLSTEQMQSFMDVLVDRGVPADKATERAQAALDKLGAPGVAKALAAPNPWNALKLLASAPSKAFKFVHQDELHAFIEKRAAAKHGAQIPNAKAKKAKGGSKVREVTPLHIDPGQLLLAPDSFVGADGSRLAQLSLSEVVAEATGVAFCTAQQLSPFLESYRKLSVGALGLVTTSEILPEAAAGAPVSNLKFPALYAPTQEAVLICGSLLQLGDESVALHKPGIAELESPDTETLRLQVFKDEVALAWDTFTEAPIRMLLQHIPQLVLCRDSHCKGDCPRFHLALEEHAEQLLLDVWARQFARPEGGRISPQQAGLFQALVRVPASALRFLQRLQVPGVYWEPRTSDGVEPHSGYSIIWMPDCDRDKVLHLARCHDRVVAIARLGKRYGLRVREIDEAAAFAEFRPAQEFVKVRVLYRYRLYPLPHGFQRRHLIQLLRTWSWTARPLQPSRGDAQGASWEVGSDCEPPAPALPAGDSFVLVTKLPGRSCPVPAALCASARTKKAILYDDPSQPSPDSDPWSGGRDPWSQWRPPPGLTPAASVSTGGSACVESKLSQVRKELAVDVQDAVQRELRQQAATQPASSPEADGRFQRLEVQVQELKAQNSKFEGWFSTFGTKLSESNQQVEAVSRALTQQQQEISQVRTEVAKQADTVQTAVASAVSSLGQELGKQLATQLAHQTQQLEGMLNKKPRQE